MLVSLFYLCLPVQTFLNYHHQLFCCFPSASGHALIAPSQPNQQSSISLTTLLTMLGYCRRYNTVSLKKAEKYKMMNIHHFEIKFRKTNSELDSTFDKASSCLICRTCLYIFAVTSVFARGNQLELFVECWMLPSTVSPHPRTKPISFYILNMYLKVCTCRWKFAFVRVSHIHSNGWDGPIAVRYY